MLVLDQPGVSTSSRIVRNSPLAPSTDTDAAKPSQAPAGNYSVSLGYLRAFITLLVVAHHAVLAYHPFAPPPAASLLAEPRWWPVFPIVDAQRWPGFMLLTAFNDMFFMALMFFLSGVFVWGSLQRQQAAAFLRDRVMRLGVPFVISAALFAPLAYYPTYLASAGSASGSGGFWIEWLSLDMWPAGPAWFLALLLAFDGVAVCVLRLVPGSSDALGRLVLRYGHRPAAAFAVLTGVSALVYVPLALAFNPLHWTTIGPLAFQTSRLLHYAVYFTAGIAVGASGVASALFSPSGRLANRWLFWSIAALLCFGVAITTAVIAATQPVSPYPWGFIAGIAFAISSAASSFALTAVFVRWLHTSVRWFDSLRSNAYGIYLVHYVAVTWLQLALLGSDAAAFAKGLMVFAGSVAISWAAAAAVRRVPGVTRII
jgi:peptidoglycan/LPS O-acetylase OafA/YrhL